MTILSNEMHFLSRQIVYSGRSPIKMSDIKALEHAIVEWRQVVRASRESYGSFDSWSQLSKDFI